MRILPLLVSLSLASIASSNPILSKRAIYPEPIAVTGNNTYIHDPTIIRRGDGTWFRLSTNGNIAIASAPDIAGPWTYLGAMLPQGSLIKIQNNQEIWAPDVSFIDGTYYCYYSVSTMGSQNSDIGVATSKTLEPGSWTDHGSIGIPSSGTYNRIDPNLYHTGSSGGTNTFFFGSAWNGIHKTSLSADFLSVASTDPIVGAFQNKSAVTEGGFMFRWTGGDGAGGSKIWFYFFFSTGACCNTPPGLAKPGDEYKTVVCRSERLDGPFVDDKGRDCLTGDGGKIVFETHGQRVYAPGGQSVIAEGSLRSPVIVYHYVDRTIPNPYAYENFLFGVNYLDFSSGWPVAV